MKYIIMLSVAISLTSCNSKDDGQSIVDRQNALKDAQAVADSLDNAQRIEDSIQLSKKDSISNK